MNIQNMNLCDLALGSGIEARQRFSDAPSRCQSGVALHFPPRSSAGGGGLTAFCLPLCAALLLSVAPAMGQPFSSGSTGADGDLHVTNHLTLNLPPDGVFHFNTITVDWNRTLTFNRNALNTPVYLLARSNVMIAGEIRVDGKDRPGNFQGGAGGPGGYDGGFGGFISGTNALPAGAGKGPGGGLRGENSSIVGSGAYSTAVKATGTSRSGTNYGNPLLIPLVGGSGGGGVDGSINGGGGGGGGAILIASDTVIRIPGGTVTASGGGGEANNSGSGGAIRLVSPRVYGNGSLQVPGGNSTAGLGRIRVDSVLKVEPNDPTEFLGLNMTPGYTLGANMVVFPSNLPRLDVVAIGTNSIPFGTGSPVFFFFDVGASTNQTVTVQARNFNTNAVPIEVALIPDSGEKVTFPGVINNSVNPGQLVVPVAVTPNTKVEVQAWIR
jgi:hypothetical protein